MKISFHTVLNAFSMALDIAESNYISHSKHVGLIAYKIAKQMNLSNEVCRNVYYASIFHDIGASDTFVETHIKDEQKRIHCEKGSLIANKLFNNNVIGDIILHHHEQWDGSGPFKIDKNNINVLSQIVYLADNLDIQFNHNEKYYYINAKKNVSEWLNTDIIKTFNPQVLEAFLEVSSSEKFWLDYLYHNVDPIIDRLEIEQETVDADISFLEKISEVFASIIDHKSPFTHNHSRGIAQIMKETTTYLGYDELTVRKSHIAGLLHDLGKLYVPNEILNKPDKLTKEETDIIRTHTYYTKLILNQIPELKDVANWSANHHEKLNGIGYPERLKAEDLGHMDRLMCVADIYQALIEPRPYRSPMKSSDAWSIIDSMVNKGELCSVARDNIKKALR